MKQELKARLFLAVIILALVGVSFSYLFGTNPTTKKPAQTAPKSAINEGAEVLINGFHANSNEVGKESWNLNAKKAEVSKSTGVAKLQDLEGNYNTSRGKSLVLHADEGTYDAASKAVTLSGRNNGVTVTSGDGYTVSSDNISWDNTRKQLRTTSVVTVKGKNIKIEGKGLVANTDQQELRITDGVKTTFH